MDTNCAFTALLLAVDRVGAGFSRHGFR